MWIRLVARLIAQKIDSMVRKASLWARKRFLIKRNKELEHEIKEIRADVVDFKSKLDEYRRGKVQDD